MIAKPLERGITEDIECGRVNMRMTAKNRGVFQKKLLLGCACIAFDMGIWPRQKWNNILIDDTFTPQVRV
jgi:hypothetical protein